MKFWDSAALVPLLVEEASSAACRRLLRSDPVVTVWALTRTELLGAIARRQRADDLDKAGATAARGRLEKLVPRWHEVDALVEVRERAERLLAVHPLRAADALQLGAALLLWSDRPRRRGLVTLDANLADAAEREGFDVTRPA